MINFFSFKVSQADDLKWVSLFALLHEFLLIVLGVGSEGWHLTFEQPYKNNVLILIKCLYDYIKKTTYINI